MPDLKRELRTTERPVEFRAAGDGSPPRAIGYASVFDHVYRVGGMFDEVIRPGAFARAIKERQDVRALWNHNRDNVLGRTKSGTCRIAEDPTGLAAEIDVPVSATREIESLERGDVDQMSFGFFVRKEQWTERPDDIPLREILDVDLTDVSPATYPASSATSVNLRSAEDIFNAYRDGRDDGDSPTPNADGSGAHRAAALRRRVEIRKRKER